MRLQQTSACRVAISVALKGNHDPEKGNGGEAAPGTETRLEPGASTCRVVIASVGRYHLGPRGTFDRRRRHLGYDGCQHHFPNIYSLYLTFYFYFIFSVFIFFCIVWIF